MSPPLSNSSHLIVTPRATEAFLRAVGTPAQESPLHSRSRSFHFLGVKISAVMADAIYHRTSAFDSICGRLWARILSIADKPRVILSATLAKLWSLAKIFSARNSDATVNGSKRLPSKALLASKKPHLSRKTLVVQFQ